MRHLLYHCFAQAQRENLALAVDILSNIVRGGILLTQEDPAIRWADPCGSTRAINVRQYRWCLTSLNEEADLRKHCEVFGPLGIGFKTEVIRGLGGFPVFYLPSPIYSDDTDSNDRLGVSLIYRLAELRTVLETATKLPSICRAQLFEKVADVAELEGAVRFFGNVFYFTDYTDQEDPVALRYYREREWRVIAGLTSDSARVRRPDGSSAYVLSEYKGTPIHNLIEDIVVHGSPGDLRFVNGHLRELGLSLRARRL